VIQVQLVVQLKEYPVVKSPAINFTVTVLDAELPSISDIEYVIKDSTLTIDLKSFLLLPKDLVNFLKLSYSTSVFINVGGSALPDRIDSACPCLRQIDQFNWLSFESNNLEVFSSDNSIAGVY